MASNKKIPATTTTVATATTIITTTTTTTTTKEWVYGSPVCCLQPSPPPFSYATKERVVLYEDARKPWLSRAVDLNHDGHHTRGFPNMAATMKVELPKPGKWRGSFWILGGWCWEGGGHCLALQFTTTSLFPWSLPPPSRCRKSWSWCCRCDPFECPDCLHKYGWEESLQGHMICPYTKTQVQNIFLNTEFVYEPFQQEMF